MSSGKRKYEKRERAVKQEETRRRIAGATAELHAEVGPARTTIAEIAKRAGVQRPTVYNNFATDKELFAACQAHFLSESPPPALDPAQGLERILTQLYGWWRANEQMSGNVARDRGAVPALDELMRETTDARFDALADALGHDKASRALIRVAMTFTTWKTLKDRGLSDPAAARLMSGRVSCT
jgi:AcrR family transcriptional regulator